MIDKLEYQRNHFNDNTFEQVVPDEVIDKINELIDYSHETRKILEVHIDQPIEQVDTMEEPKLMHSRMCRIRRGELCSCGAAFAKAKKVEDTTKDSEAKTPEYLQTTTLGVPQAMIDQAVKQDRERIIRNIQKSATEHPVAGHENFIYANEVISYVRDEEWPF